MTPTPAADEVARDVEVVRTSGLFDAAYYAEHNPDVVEAGDDLVTHFCRTGWRELRRPRADFDVWWYWTTHLDPRSEDQNPFVHWVREGRDAGLTGLPTSTRPAPATPPPGPGCRRVCLFAAFDRDGRVDDHVVHYVRELSRHADVYVLHDGYLPPEELARLDGLAAGAWGIRHGAYDFGSWSKLAGELVGWDVLSTYDEVLLVNDSCYLLRPLDEVFSRMDETPADWWGLQVTKGLARTRDVASNAFTEPIPVAALHDGLLDEFEDDAFYDFHVGSYFVAYRKRVVDDPRFRRILDSVGPQRGKLAIIQKYEIGLTHFLVGNGFGFETYADALYPFHPLFTEWHFTLIGRGFPLLKKYFLYQNHYDVPDLAEWKERVRALVPDAPVEMFERDLLRTAPDDRLRRSHAIRRGPDGVVVVPEVLTGGAFRRADRASAKDDDWWAFPVCPDEHTLPANSRAILEEVRHDPAVTKVVLTRSRGVDLPGQNLLVLPLLSPEGQQALMRSRYVFVQGQPRRTLGEPLAPEHRLVLVRDGLALGGGRPPAPDPPRVEREPADRWHGVLTASEVDQVTVLGLNYPARYVQGWRTGVPAHDFLVRPSDELPPELAADERRLRDELDGRPLVLFVAGRRGRDRAAYELSDKEVAWLADWSTRTGAVLGVREHPQDLDRSYSAQLSSVALDLSHHRYPLLHAVLRGAAAVLTDYAGAALDVAVTGRPVVSFAPDLEVAAPGLALDMEHVFPGPVCRTFDELTHALDRVLETPDADAAARHARRRRLLADVPDGASAARVVERVRRSSAAAVVA